MQIETGVLVSLVGGIALIIGGLITAVFTSRTAIRGQDKVESVELFKAALAEAKTQSDRNAAIWLELSQVQKQAIDCENGRIALVKKNGELMIAIRILRDALGGADLVIASIVADSANGNHHEFDRNLFGAAQMYIEQGHEWVKEHPELTDGREED